MILSGCLKDKASTKVVNKTTQIVMMNREEMIAEMLQYFDEKAEVGLFWYHPIEEVLFEVYSMPATLLKQGQVTYPKLHKTIWQELRYRTLNKKKRGLPYDSIYLSDYTEVPRGRIFFKEGIFLVVTGNWITDKIKKMIIKRFNLQKCKVSFKTDTHWDIGHGWSTEEDFFNFDF